MALKFIQQDAATLRTAFAERKKEYESLRAGGELGRSNSSGGYFAGSRFEAGDLQAFARVEAADHFSGS